VAKIKYPNKQRTTVQYVKAQHVLTVTRPAGGGSTLKPAELRRAYRVDVQGHAWKK